MKKAEENRITMSTQYEEFKHPNLMTGVSHSADDRLLPNGKRGPGVSGPQFGDLNDREYGNKERGCAYYFKKFDDQILRPIFVYKYAEKKHKPEISFDTLLRASEKDYDIGLNFNTASQIRGGSRLYG